MRTPSARPDKIAHESQAMDEDTLEVLRSIENAEHAGENDDLDGFFGMFGGSIEREYVGGEELNCYNAPSHDDFNIACLESLAPNETIEIQIAGKSKVSGLIDKKNVSAPPQRTRKRPTMVPLDEVDKIFGNRGT